MKKNKLFFISIAFIALGAITLLSCDKDETGPVPDFTFEINDKTVTFTNTSIDATSYRWTFGDESEPSTEENPIHVYDAYGDYRVRLTADGEVTLRQTISVIKEWPEIAIDGDFSDWADIDPFYSGYGDASGKLTEIRVTSDAAASKLYFYVKGDLTGSIMSIWINADGDVTTGWQDNGYIDNGAEYQFEFELGVWSSLYAWGADEDQGWPWTDDITPDDGAITTYSPIVGGTEIEFVLETSLMKNPPMSNQKIGLFFNLMDSDWETVGTMPPSDAEPLETVKMFSFQ